MCCITLLISPLEKFWRCPATNSIHRRIKAEESFRCCRSHKKLIELSRGAIYLSFVSSTLLSTGHSTWPLVSLDVNECPSVEISRYIQLYPQVTRSSPVSPSDRPVVGSFRVTVNFTPLSVCWKQNNDECSSNRWPLNRNWFRGCNAFKFNFL